jgi:hypothetical protein
MKAICVSLFLVCISKLAVAAEPAENMDPKIIIQKIRSAYTSYFAIAHSGEGEARVSRLVRTHDGHQTSMEYSSLFKFSAKSCRFNSVSSMDPEERVEVLLTEEKAFVYLIDDARLDVTPRKNFDELEEGDYLPITPMLMTGFVGHDVYGILGYFEKADRLEGQRISGASQYSIRAKYNDPVRGEARIVVSAETFLIYEYYFTSSMRGGWQKKLSVTWEKFGDSSFPVAFTLMEEVATGARAEIAVRLMNFNLNPSIPTAAFSPDSLPLHDGVIVYDLVERKKYYWGRPDRYDLPMK